MVKKLLVYENKLVTRDGKLLAGEVCCCGGELGDGCGCETGTKPSWLTVLLDGFTNNNCPNCVDFNTSWDMELFSNMAEPGEGETYYCHANAAPGVVECSLPAFGAYPTGIRFTISYTQTTSLYTLVVGIDSAFVPARWQEWYYTKGPFDRPLNCGENILGSYSLVSQVPNDHCSGTPTAEVIAVW